VKIEKQLYSFDDENGNTCMISSFLVKFCTGAAPSGGGQGAAPRGGEAGGRKQGKHGHRLF
jgi:hypothetical protein